MAGNHQVFVGLYHIRGDTALRRADARPVLAVGRLVELQSEPAACLADGAADWRRILADAGGEDDAVEAPERCRERADPASRAIAKHLDRKSRAWLRARQQLAAIRRNTRKPEHSGTTVEEIDHRVRRFPLLLDQAQHDSRIERAATGAHRQAIEGGKSHRRPDLSAGLDRSR